MYVSRCDADDDDDNEKTLYVLLKCFLMSIQVFYLISYVVGFLSISSNLKLSPWKSCFCLAPPASVCGTAKKLSNVNIFIFNESLYVRDCTEESICSRHDDDNFDWILTRADVNNSLFPARITHKKLYLLRKLFHFSHRAWTKTRTCWQRRRKTERVEKNENKVNKQKKLNVKISENKMRIQWIISRIDIFIDKTALFCRRVWLCCGLCVSEA